MKDARKILSPKYEFNRTSECIALVRDEIIYRIYPKELKFQLDRLVSNSEVST